MIRISVEIKFNDNECRDDCPFFHDDRLKKEPQEHVWCTAFETTCDAIPNTNIVLRCSECNEHEERVRHDLYEVKKRV